MFRPIGIFGNKDDGVYPPHLTYSCSIVLEKQSMVVVSPSPNAKTLEFAISFRVRQWVDENKRVLVVPFYEPNDDFTPLWLIPENTIATIVNNPAIDTRSDSPPFIASTSVASIVPKEHVCTFGLLVRQEDVPFFTFNPTVPVALSSINYPWVFDDPNEWNGDNKWNLETKLPHTGTVAELIVVEGGNITVWVFNCRSSNRNVPSFIISISEKTTTWNSTCFSILWSPEKSHGNRFGFWIKISASLPKELDDDFCYLRYELSDEEPILVFHGDSIYNYISSSINDFYGYLCIDSDCDEGNDCEIVVEIVIHCPIDEIGNCTEVSPLQINGEYSKLNCTNT
ncbi:unnamed protein product, partial [Mesorhabditis belari]|uniref:Uncharacterized protein n=1 Tax=Mesorhabditis belari TaxID=2138241 RepID=A0AAF3ECG4_9BILA